MKVAAYVPDLMDQSRFGSVDAEVSFCRTPEELVTAAVDAELVVLDAGRPGILDVVPLLGETRVVAFMSHVDTDLRAAVQRAGITEVMPRSRFFSHIAEIVTKGNH